MTDTSVHANNPPETAEYSSPGVSQEKHSDGDSEERSAQLKHINQEPSTPAQHTVPPPPDGGYGWVCCICTALINGHTWGLNSSYGVFLSHYLKEDTFPGSSPLEYAFVGSLSIACAMLISPLATTTTRLFGTRFSLLLGMGLETGSLIAASFATKIWQLALSQGVCFGLGMGFLFVASVGVVPQWFKRRRSLANGIATSGSGFGGLVYSLAVGAMLPAIGLPWTFRVLGILCFIVNGICSILIRDRNSILGSSQLAFDSHMLRRKEYLLLAGFGWFSMLAYVVLIFSLANYARRIVGLGASEAALISALFNLGQGLGRPPIGYFSDTVGRINMAMLMTFLAGLFALAIWVPAKSYGVLIFYALIGGSVAGTFWCTIAAVTVEVVGLKHVPSGLGLMWLVITLPVAFSEPIALEMVAGTDSYLGTQLWTGFMYIAAALCLLLLRGWKIGEKEERERMEEDGDEELKDVKEGELPVKALKAGRKNTLKNIWKFRKV